MGLKSRLSRLQSQAGAGLAAAATPPPAAQLRRRLARLHPERVQARTPGGRGTLSAAALAEALGGERVAEGVIRIHQSMPLAGLPGPIDLRALGSNPRLPGEADDARRRQVYLDTETTGLSGGSGTLAFLIGIAVPAKDAITLTQLLLTRFDAEASMLALFAETLTPHDRLVSYNGKSYDLPLLLTRFRMQGLAQPFGGLPHLDLLHPVRRVFGRRWQDCRLQTLEQKLLGFYRVDDLPGSEAPAAWFDYVRGRQDRRLIRVVEHNRQDIVSLAVAHNALARALRQPQTPDLDLPALARWLAEHDEAAARTLLLSHAEALCSDGRRLLGHYCRRAGDWDRAVATWEALAAAGCTDSLERLAKYHEHISKDLAAALRYCERLPQAVAQERRRRIERKLASGRNGR